MTEETSNHALNSGVLATSSVLVALGVAGALNLFASQLYMRVDLTANKIYTLHEASREAVGALEEPMQVRVFVSPDMPPPFHTLSSQISDILTEYRAASKGKLSFEIIEPTDDAAVEEDARGYGCEKVAIGQQNENEVSLRAVYKCVAFLQGDRQEVIEDLRTSGNPASENFEFSFTRAILNLKANDEPARKVGFVSGYGGPAAQQGFGDSLKQPFSQLYGNLVEPTIVDLSADDAEISEDITALVLLGPTEPFEERSIFLLDQFVRRGGSIAWMQSSSTVDRQLQQQLMQQMGAQNRRIPEIKRPVDTGLNPLFATWGVTHNGDFVLDRAHGMSMGFVMTQQGLAQISNPATFQITKIDRSLPFLSNLPPMALPAPASLTITDGARDNPEVRVYEALVSAPEATARPEPPTNFDYDALVQPTPDETPGPFVLAAALEGNFPSYYDEHPLPDGITEAQLVERSPEPGRIFVLGSGDFFFPQEQMGYSGQLASLGQELLFGVIDWVAQDSALSKIRSKTLPTLVGEVEKGTQRRIQFINIALVPALFALMGFGRRPRRRGRRANIEL
ncbi:MAG: GldG family protein [Myxococcota bacterium]